MGDGNASPHAMVAHHEAGALWAIELVGDRGGSSEGPPSADVSESGETSAPEVAEAMGAASTQEATDRLRRGCRCFVARVEGVLACYGWLTVGGEWIGEMDRRLLLPGDEAYIWDCATLPEFRRRGLYTTLLAHMLDVLAAEGCARAWIGSARSNIASVRAFASAGFRPVVRLDYWRLGPVSFFRTAAWAGAEAALVVEARAALGAARSGWILSAHGW